MLNQIVDVLGGQSGQYDTVVPVLQQIYTLLEAGITDPEAIAEAVHNELVAHPEWTTTVQDGSITGVKIADDTIPDAKLAQTGGVLDVGMHVVMPTEPVSVADVQTLDLTLVDAREVKVTSVPSGSTVRVCGANYFDMADYLDFSEYAYSSNYNCKPIYLAPNTSYVVKMVVVDSTELSAINSVVVIDMQAFRYSGGSWSVRLDGQSADVTKTLTTGESGCLYLNLLSYGADKQSNLDHMVAGCKVMISTATSDYVDYDGITIGSGSTVVTKGKDRLFANSVRTAATMSDAETATVTVTRMVADYETIAQKVQPHLAKETMKPLLVELCADFNWVAWHEIAAFSASNPKFTTEDGTNNAYFAITGNEGDSYVTVTTGGNADISDMGSDTAWWGAVIGWGDGTYEPCNARYRDASTIEVYPPLKQGITDGVLGNIKTGIHLSNLGYTAYAQAAFKANPKWCEKGAYLAKWDYDEGLTPLTKFGGTAYLGLSNSNLSDKFMSKYTTQHAYLGFVSGYTPHTTRTGITWDATLDPTKRGYLEIFIGGVTDAYIDYPEGQEFTIEVYLDGELAYTRTKTNNICERLCFDYANAKTGRVRIYSDKWDLVDGNSYGFSISRMTWWVNEIDHGTSLIPKFKTVAQMFDSWGVFDNERSATELHRLQSAQSGVTTRYENHSRGSQTSAWGKAWFYENVEKYRPQIMLVDFLVNDTNSTTTSGFPATVEGPDGTLYDNIISVDEYVANMNDLFDMAIANGIQPIMFGYALQGPGYVTRWMALLDSARNLSA